MKPKNRSQAASSSHRVRWRWFGWAAATLLVVASLGAWQFWRATAPVPPLINTAEFDPLIAQAIAQARTAIVRAPRFAAAWGQMGMVLLAHELRAPARECFAQAARLAPLEPRWPYYLGLAQVADNPVTATAQLERAVRLFPTNEIFPRLKLADTLLSVGRMEEAETQYRRVWQLQTNSGPAGLGLAKVAMAQNRPADAVTFLDAVTDNPATRRAAYRLLLNANQQLGRTGQAEQAARILATLTDDESLGDPFANEIEKLKTGEKVWTDLADDWIKGDRAADAARLLEKTVQTYPKSDRALFLLGRARLRLGDHAGAEAALARAVQLAPDSVETQMQLGVLRLSQRRAKAAQPCFVAAIRAKPNLGEAWFNLGLTLGSDANRQEGMAAFREAIRLKPNLTEAYLGLAVALRVDGQKEAAAQELHRALELDPEEPLRQKLLDQLKLVETP